MKLQKLIIAISMLYAFIATAQNQHSDANAASPSNLLINDTNTTTGWASGGTISSIIPSPQNNGAYALQLVSTALTDNERVIEYTFDAIINEVYTISIWVKENDANNSSEDRPEFSNWTDLTGFSTTIVTTGTTWTEYTFSVTATSTTPVIRIYAHTNLGTIGDSILIDNVSITSSTADTTPPSSITDLSATNITETSLTLNWTVATDNVLVTNYGVFKDGVLESLTSGANTYNVTGLTLGNSYVFTVYSIDAVNNISLISNTLNETTIDITIPNTPANLTSSNITFSSVDLSWEASTSPDVVGYRIYQNEVLIGSTTIDITYLVEGLEELTSYDFYVTAIDASNNESIESNTETINTLKEDIEVHYTNLNSNIISADWTTKDLFAVGNVGIGTQPDPNYKLAIDGNVIAEEVRVALKANWPDYVFEKGYNLPTLSEVENHINKYGHLKNIPSANETKENGISIGEMNSKLLRKIEELTLYIIQQEKNIKQLSAENQELKSFSSRLLEIEQTLKKLNK